MSSEKVVLGLDIGVGSLGWGLVRLREEKYVVEKGDGTVDEKYKISDGNIIATGIREFQVPQDRQQKSLALVRGSGRRSRRTTRRKARRLKSLIRLAKEFGLIGDNFDREDLLKPKKGDKESTWDIWLIRKQALERKLTDIEFFRVLYHIANHRGFYFHTKAEFLPEEDEKKGKREKEQDPEESKEEKGEAKKGLRRTQKMLEEGRWKTVGEMFWEEFKQTNPDNRRKRNTKDKYEKSIHRSLLRNEIDTIFAKQEELGNATGKEELKRRYIDEVLTHEQGIDDERLQKMMRRCEFTSQLCAPKESYTAERFALFNRLNVLRLVAKDNRDREMALDEEQRNKIVGLAYKNTKVTFAQIRTELELHDELHLRFNLCSYKEKDPEYTRRLDCRVQNGKLQFEEKHRVEIVNIRTGEVSELCDEVKRVFRSKKLWPNSRRIYLYYSDIRKQLTLPADVRFAKLSGYTKSAEEFGSGAKYIKQFEDKETFIELKGYHKIRRALENKCGRAKWEELSKDIGKLDVIAEALTYCKSDETRAEYMNAHRITDEGVIDAVLTLNMKEVANFSREALGNLLVHMEKGLLFNEAKEKCGYGKIHYKKQAILDPYEGFFQKNPVVARVISQTRKVVNGIVRKYGDECPIDQIHIEIATELASSKRRKAEIAQGQARYREDKKRAAERCREFGLDPEEGQNLVMFRFAEQQNSFCPYTGKAISFYPTSGDKEVYIKDCEIDHIIPMSRSFNDSLNNKVLCSPEANQNKRDRIPFEWFEDTYGKDGRQWMEFQRRVEKMHGVPYAKRKNLVRKSWTEKDKERFISRNLNDTRYAARHIADYLRKYFDFSKSGRNDIKDVSRIQLRSGGVTAFLRHMWGLNKDRGENDLHHAIDALVVACSTYGHVYLVSNLSKEIERKGKSWYKHFGRDKFRPWDSVREDIQKAAGEVFISRMPRHTVTAEAHKETIQSLEGIPLTKRVVKINKGYAEMGEMVRADIFMDIDGRNCVVPIYTTDIFAKRPLPHRYVPDDRSLAYEDWPSVRDMEFRFSVFKDDLISINGKMYYVSFFDATTPNVNVKNIDGSIFPDKAKSRDPHTKKIGYRPKSRTRRCILKKYSVDVLGNYREVTQEKRLPSKLEDSKKPG